MAVYAIGDVQGCYDALQRLLESLRFDPASDRLWFCGDLVNRGPSSLAVLRLVYSLGESALSVLGNHDLTLLAVAAGCRQARRKDTFHEILEASDREILLEWLQHCPVLHHDAQLGFTLTHAGLPPQWDLGQAKSCAAEVEAVLRGPNSRDFLAQMFGSEPRRWQDDLMGVERLRFTVNGLTRMRFCRADGSLDFDHKGPPGSQPAGLIPWFDFPQRRNTDLNLLFAHWASLGYYRAPGIWALDSACVWGERLTAVCLNAPEYVCSVPCAKPTRIT